MKGFQYNMALYLKTEYYTIQLTPQIRDMTTIVSEFEKISYNWLPVVMYASGDIFQAKLDPLLGEIKVLKTYINNIMVLSNNTLNKHKEYLRVIFHLMSDYGLIVNTKKLSIGLNDIPYLVYI